MAKTFTVAPSPTLHFGPGKFSSLPIAIREFGQHALLVTGARSFAESVRGQAILQRLHDEGFKVDQYRISKEPDPFVIDEAVNRFQSAMPDCVVAIGGGSALDAGKAISAMLPLHKPVKNYLEGLGAQVHPGSKIPFIAVPTTSGTGSEATKNAVISETSETGYKRSLRHNKFVPNVAVVDPELTLSCPQPTSAASGMDAFTQLLESYVSSAANRFTNAIALEGLECVARSLLRTYQEGDNLEARTDMSWAAYLSGVALANAGLGIVHGFASPIAGYFDIPHGVICSALMESANRASVRKLRSEDPNGEALEKYAIVGKIFAQDQRRSDDYYIDSLLHQIGFLRSEMKIPRLSQFGITPSHFRKIITATDNKNNPVKLDADELLEILEESC